MRALNIPLTLIDILKLGFAGSFASILVPGMVGYEGVRIWFLRTRHPDKTFIGISTMVLDRLIGMIALFGLGTLCGMGLLLMSNSRWTGRLLLVSVPVLALKGEKDVSKIAKAALDEARAKACNVLIFDTAGRLQIDEELVQELVDLKSLVKPQEILLVLDAATGQEAVSVATHFDEALGITGAILTKLDGDARGGAALSFKSVTGKPIKFAGLGEKLDEFEAFHPERMAGRILGMGDVVSLVEKAAEAIEEDEAKRMEEKMRKGEFTLEDFLEQMRAMKKMGPLENIVGMLPGGDEALKGADLDKGQEELRRMEGLICAMTPTERRNPTILNASRRKRIAKGSGVKVSELNGMLNKFFQMQQMMKKMGKMQKMMAKMGGGQMAKMMGR